jgi:hypothetical protein
MRIFVKSYHFDWEEPITCYWGFKDEDGDFVEEGCNHHGSTMQELCVNGGQRSERWEEVLVCDHCGAEGTATDEGLIWTS